jgi:cytidylate kinase
MVIAIDGPAGAGKSTVARKVASHFGLDYLDTGAMYRALTLKALREHVDLDDEKALARLARSLELETEFVPGEEPSFRIYMDGEEVTGPVRSREVSMHVSRVSSHRAVRQEMVRRQRRMAEKGGIVVEGRDIGTVVLPRAHVKFFLTATVRERAERRRREMMEEGREVSLAVIEREIARRDKLDSTRACNPLKKAPDAVLVDTTGLGVEEVVDRLRVEVERYLRDGGADG